MQARRILEIKPRADEQAQPCLLRRHVRAHDPGQRVAVSNTDGCKPKRFGLRDQFLGVRRPAQK